MQILEENLKRYIREQSLLSFVNSDNLLVLNDETYQVLFIKKPGFILEELIEVPSSKKDKLPSLLIYNRVYREISEVPLCFSASLTGLYDETEKIDFKFSPAKPDFFFAIYDNRAVLIQGDAANCECLNVVIFSLNGEIISAWRIKKECGVATKIKWFKEIIPGHWLLNMETPCSDQRGLNYRKLILLSKSSSEEFLLLSGSISAADFGLLSDSAEIWSWFSDTKFITDFFLLASDQQFCAYNFDSIRRDYLLVTNTRMFSKIEELQVVDEVLGYQVKFATRNPYLLSKDTSIVTFNFPKI